MSKVLHGVCPFIRSNSTSRRKVADGGRNFMLTILQFADGAGVFAERACALPFAAFRVRAFRGAFFARFFATLCAGLACFTACPAWAMPPRAMQSTILPKSFFIEDTRYRCYRRFLTRASQIRATQLRSPCQRTELFVRRCQSPQAAPRTLSVHGCRDPSDWHPSKS